MLKKRSLATIFAALLLVSALLLPAAAQLTQLPPEVSDPALLKDIFQATETLQQNFRAMDFKERVSFRLAAVINQNHTNNNVDFRQSADYAVTLRPGQPPERKFLQASHMPQFGVRSLLKNIDVTGLQETLPTVANLNTALLGFISKDYVNGYKELGHEQIKKHRALKLGLRFRPNSLPVEHCNLWIDEQTHAPLRAELKIGSIGRFNNVLLKISYEDGENGIPKSISQEMNCDTYDSGVPLRLEHNSVYTELRPANNK